MAQVGVFTLSSMEFVDLAEKDPLLLEAMDVLAEASSVDDPQDIQRTFARSMQALSGADAYLGISTRGLGDGEFKVTRRYYRGEPLGEQTNPWQDWDEIPLQRGGVISRLIANPRPQVVHGVRLDDDPAIPEEYRGFRSIFAVPLLDNGEAKNWGVMFRSETHWPIDQGRLRDFTIRANMIGNTVNLLVTKQRYAELNLRLSDQLEQVAMIQKSLLPQRTPSVDGLRIATSYLTSNEAGGDYFDFFDMGRGHFGVLIADVSGHGAGAATVMAMMRTILHGYQDREKGPAAMLEYANRELLRNDLGSNFVTAFLADFNADRSHVVYANAGHNPPLVRVPDGSTLTVDDGRSLPLGILDGAEYEQASHPTMAGASVVLYTDGIVEASPPGRKADQFGLDRLSTAVTETSGEPSEVVTHTHERLFEFTGLRSRDDDQTIVALQHAE